ncbi:hypothetical protein D3C76_971180 [compost metagenome]
MESASESKSGHSLKTKKPQCGNTEASEINAVIDQENNVMANNSTNVIPFNFGKQRVRTLLVDGEPWFVATDISAALQYRDSFNMCRNLDDDEKGTQIVSTLGGAQEMLAINESGLYSAILRSRKSEAKIFKKWVTGEVLPAIRKTGRYDDQQGRLATLIGQTIGTDGFHILGAIVKGKVASLPSPVQRRATAKIWSQVHAAFGVRSAADIPAEHLDGARNFIAAYAVVEGEFLPKRDQVKIVGGPQKRYLVSFDHKGEQRVEEVADDACVLSTRDLIKGMVMSPGDIPVSTPDMFEFLMAAVVNLRGRFNYIARKVG